MMYFLSFNSSTGKFQEISEEEAISKGIVLSLSKQTKIANLYLTLDEGLVNRRIAQRIADTITRSGFFHSEAGRIGENYSLDILTGKNMENLLRSTISIEKDGHHNDLQSTSSQKDLEGQKLSKGDDITTSLSEQSRYTFKIPILSPGLDNVKIISTLMERDISSISHGSQQTVGFEPYSRYDTVNGVDICYNLWIFSPKYDRFQTMRGMLFRGAKGALLYYNPNDPTSIVQINELFEELRLEVPDVVTYLIRCGKVENILKETITEQKDIQNHYQISREDDPLQLEILEILGKKLIDSFPIG